MWMLWRLPGRLGFRHWEGRFLSLSVSCVSAVPFVQRRLQLKWSICTLIIVHLWLFADDRGQNSPARVGGGDQLCEGGWERCSRVNCLQAVWCEWMFLSSDRHTGFICQWRLVLIRSVGLCSSYLKLERRGRAEWLGKGEDSTLSSKWT